LKNKNKVTKAVKGSASLKATRRTKIQEWPISYMEKLLMAWIEYQTQKHIPPSTMTITTKAKTFLRYWKKYDVEFTTSSGRFKRFKDHYSLYYVWVVSLRVLM
jgi:hypothetical protein